VCSVELIRDFGEGSGGGLWGGSRRAGSRRGPGMAVVSDTAPAPSAAAAAGGAAQQPNAAVAAASTTMGGSSNSAGGNAGNGGKMTSPLRLGVKGAWSQVVRGEAPPADAAQNVGSRSDAPPAALAAEVQQHFGLKVNSEKSGGGIGGESPSVSSKGMEEPTSSRIEKSSEGEQHPEAESSKGELGQGSAPPGGGGVVAGDHVVKPAKPAWKNASSTLGKTLATGLVMGAATWSTLGDAWHSKTVPSEQPLKIPTQHPIGIIAIHSQELNSCRRLRAIPINLQKRTELARLTPFGCYTTCHHNLSGLIKLGANSLRQMGALIHGCSPRRVNLWRYKSPTLLISLSI
jgi:hypothetical protein